MAFAKSIILSTFMAAAAGAMAASLKPDTLIDEQMQRKLFMLSQKPGAGGTTLIQRGLIDTAAGIVCDWNITGRIDPETKDIAARVNHLGCRKTTRTPARWVGGEEKPMDRVITETRTQTFDAAAGKVTEEAVSARNSLGVSSTYRRVWDFATKQVCVISMEGQIKSDGTVNTYVNLDMGCHSIPDNAYTQNLKNELFIRGLTLPSPKK